MSRLRIARIDPAEGPRQSEWLEALRHFDPLAARTLKAEGESHVWRTTLLGRDVVIKSRDLRGLGERVKCVLGRSRGHRHWLGAGWLKENGFATAQPLLLAHEGGLRAREWLVIEALAGKTLLQHMADQDLAVGDEHAVARAVGRQVSGLFRAGRFNRDHKPSNLIVMRNASGFDIAVIDCVAIRKGKDGSRRMLHALAVEPLGLGILPRRTILARVISSMVEADFAGHDQSLKEVRMAQWAVRRAFRDLVRDSLQKHGDPTPRTNPLGPAGR